MYLKDLLQTQQTCYQQLAGTCRTTSPEIHTKTSSTKPILKEQQKKKETLFLASHGDLKRPPDEKPYTASKSLKLSCNTKLNLSLDCAMQTSSTSMETQVYETQNDGTQPESDTKQFKDYDFRPKNSEHSVDTTSHPDQEENRASSMQINFDLPNEDWWMSLEKITKPMEDIVKTNNPYPLAQDDSPNDGPYSPAFLAQNQNSLEVSPRPVLKWKRGLYWQYWNDPDSPEESMIFPGEGPIDDTINDIKTKEEDPTKDSVKEDAKNDQDDLIKSWLEDPTNILMIDDDPTENEDAKNKRIETWFEEDPHAILRESY